MNRGEIKNSIKPFWDDTLLEMFPSRSLFIHKKKELLISDIYLGKGEYLTKMEYLTQMKEINLTLIEFIN
tara:strand:+ start:459 stop:668 length:210 start_codon:yes stop_codon:yes gene_type:complete